MPVAIADGEFKFIFFVVRQDIANQGGKGIRARLDTHSAHLIINSSQFLSVHLGAGFLQSHLAEVVPTFS